MFCCVFSLFCYLIYGLIAVFVAILSALFLSEQFRKFTFAKLSTTERVQKWGKVLFAKHRPVWLKDFSDLKSHSPNEKLKVLEVGVGDGVNFELYPDNCKLTVLDYNDNFKEKFMENIKKHPKIEFDKYLTGNVEDMNQIEDNTFDVVLVTHLFCSVGDVQKGLNEVKRVLKEGGKFFFMEHGGYHQVTFKNNLWSLLQFALEPLWKIMFCGCHLTRQNWLLIQATGFTSTKINHCYPENLPGFLRPHIWGYAVK